MASSKKAVATKSENSVAAFSFEEHSGQGLENVSAETLTIPRLALLQDLSPQKKRSKPEYIEGAEEGLFCDVTMAELYGAEIVIVPVYFLRQWLVWKPRESGGGLVAVHDHDPGTDKMDSDENGKPIDDDGNSVSETYQFYVLLLNRETKQVERKFYPLSSSGIKRAKRFLTLATSIKLQGSNGEYTPPLFYSSYLVRSVPESGPKGDWHTPIFERLKPIAELEDEGFNPQSVYDAAVEFYKMISAGEVKADMSQDESQSSGGGSSAANVDESEPM